ncbi:hypothetical protein ADK86_20785 [Streptomyces sp. NRRL F-5755]|uniref:hypothetical protein n=1 Tax=Streptomyces sp. NRRL F-5755 TaxID=1519475 RepID=UPI0006AEE3F3|nr:hypothetical protein [Streptomyces sp. NRRL F-5755]KOT92213.1 hypothetical protein ADK86_20785 [Streptomyces sp. NRRL F-5755]
MNRRTTTVMGVAVAAASAAGLALSAAGPAAASQFYGGTLHPGEQRCVQQSAQHTVRADGRATGQGAKFKLQYQGATVPGTGSPGLVTAYAAELRDTWAGWPGAGDYTACVTNNGTADTNVRLTLKTDGEVT